MLAICFQPARANDVRDSEDALRSLFNISTRIQQNDCAGAIAILNDGLAQRDPALLELAGAMTEDGICIKASWARAERYYVQAANKGRDGAVRRLISHHARQEPIASQAVALWWARDLKGESSGRDDSCRIASDPEKGVDGFVETIAVVPPEWVRACAYVVGVTSEAGILARMIYAMPRTTDEYTIRVRFYPSAGRIEVLANDGATPVRNSIREAVTKEWERAMARFNKPQGIDPKWVVEVEYVYRF
jgi:hypothetical protein